MGSAPHGGRRPVPSGTRQGVRGPLARWAGPDHIGADPGPWAAYWADAGELPA